MKKIYREWQAMQQAYTKQMPLELVKCNYPNNYNQIHIKFKSNLES